MTASIAATSDTASGTAVRATRAERSAVPTEPAPEPALARLVGRAPVMGRIREVVRLAAAFPSTVLIRGESGTGKELAARAIHALSPRAQAPFVTVDCTVLTETLFESILFGHEKGSFSGAIASTPGLVRSAEGGTIFLDEIGELPLPEQAKLLRLIQERTVLPVGSAKPIPVDVRIVAATHRDLHRMVAQGTFRADLLYRLDVVSILMPALRERSEDIPLIARAIMADLSERFGVTRRLSDAAIDALLLSQWPGNVRQMAAMLERAAVLCGGEVIEPQHLDLPAAPAAEAAPAANAPTRLQQSVADAVRHALEIHGGNRAAAARHLGIARGQLYRLMHRHGLIESAATQR
ncbi:MAG: sigma 54-interacting transcriptional regulator [Phycisphaerales bacterium]